jgi:hypothetical protein
MFARSGTRCRFPLAMVPSDLAVFNLDLLADFLCLHWPGMLAFLHQCVVLFFDVSESLLAVTSLDVSAVFYINCRPFCMPHVGRHFVNLQPTKLLILMSSSSFFCRYNGYVPFTCPNSRDGMVIMTCGYLGRVASRR